MTPAGRRFFLGGGTDMASHRPRIRFKIGVLTLLLGVIGMSTTLFLFVVDWESGKSGRETADRLFAEIADKAVLNYSRLMDMIAGAVEAIADSPSAQNRPADGVLAAPPLGLLAQALVVNNDAQSVFIGRADGVFYQLIDLDGDPPLREFHKAPEEARFVFRFIKPGAEAGTSVEYTRYYTKHLGPLERQTESASDYDPRKRPWYGPAMRNQAVHFSSVYRFSQTGRLGFTASRVLADGSGVVGLDVELVDFADFLKRQVVSKGGGLFLVGEAHDLDPTRPTGANGGARIPLFIGGERPLLRAAFNLLAKSGDGADLPRKTTLPVLSEGVDHLIRLIDLDDKRGFGGVLVVGAPLSDFTGPFDRLKERLHYAALACLVLMIPVAVLFARRISIKLELLGGQAERVRRFDFTDAPRVESVIREIDDLGEAVSLMRTDVRDKTQALFDTQGKLQTLVDRGVGLASESDVTLLLERIVAAALELTRSAGAVLYLMDEDELKTAFLSADGQSVSFIEERGGTIHFESLLACAAQEKKTLYTYLACEAVDQNRSAVYADLEAVKIHCGERALADHPTLAPPRNLATTPIRNIRGEVLGVIQLVDSRDPKTGEFAPFDGRKIGFIEALAGQAGAALDNKRLLLAQRRLFDAFIALIAQAIDAKSPYTGGHCTRVPILAEMIAKAAHESQTGPLADFRFADDDARREFHIAAWLHDCGKVTTPEYVVDKAVKLETLYNRIHEIRTRFEVLDRDAEIALLKGMRDEPHKAPELLAAYAAEAAALQDDFAFIAKVNVGGEFLSDADVARIRRIGERTWRRRFDDALGLSDAEAKRLAESEPGAASFSPDRPVPETLLADKPRLRIPRERDRILDPRFGFRIEPTELAFNQGEIHNLTVRRGTLTEEERFTIQDHVVQTIVMLGGLPFPKEIAHAPEIAGAHHETLDGTGYPRKLKAAQMSVPARILALADVFEALTAGDRPYKKAKTLADSLTIMAKMRDAGHLCPDVFDFFLDSGLYLTYAERFLAPEQIGPVDVAAYKRGSAA